MGSSLEHADLSSNMISTLLRSSQALLSTHHPLLRFLDLSQNNIAEIPPGTFSGLAFLRHLDLSHNRLQSLAGLGGAGAPATLETLLCHHNGLDDLEGLQTLPALCNLDLAENRVAQVGVLEACAALRRVNLQGNFIREMRQVRLAVVASYTRGFNYLF